jgi:hypothetical protein
MSLERVYPGMPEAPAGPTGEGSRGVAGASLTWAYRSSSSRMVALAMPPPSHMVCRP